MEGSVEQECEVADGSKCANRTKSTRSLLMRDMIQRPLRASSGCTQLIVCHSRRHFRPAASWPAEQIETASQHRTME